MNKVAGFIVALSVLLTGNSVSASDVPGVTEAMFSAPYWVNKTSAADQLLMSRQDIQQANQKLVSENPFVVDPLAQDAQLSGEKLRDKVLSISTVPSGARFYPDGRQLTAEDYLAYQQNLNLDAIVAVNPVRFAVVTQRSALRTFPTTDRVLNSGMDKDLDRFQETAVFPGEAVAVLHSSRDGEWALVQNYHYLAWVKRSALGFASREQVADFINSEDFVLVTGAKIFTTYNPEDNRTSEVQLDMGVKLPRLTITQNQLKGQNPYASYVVGLPVRGEQGQLQVIPTLIAKSPSVSTHYLAMTPSNIIRQAFKFLGERYGWGHDYNGRDCTGFVGEIYKTFGLLMPRNSGQQGSGEYGINWRFEKNQSAQVVAQLADAQVGDLIYVPGHVMMYIGKVDGEPFVIHDVKGLSYYDAQGDYYRGTLNGVSVTPVLPLQLNANTAYTDRIYAIKRVAVEAVK